jgi:hypothetical protein
MLSPRTRRELSVRLLVAFAVGAPTLFFAVSRNYGCRASSLAGVRPPFGNDFFPANITMIERNDWFQYSLLVDVYDSNSMDHLGYFYDMHFGLWMRFGYSDAQGRTRFEATYPSFTSRFAFWRLELELRRCDAEPGRNDERFRIKEDWSQRSWWCPSGCRRAFDIERRGADGATARPVGTAAFDSQIEWVGDGLIKKLRHAWFMQISEPSTGERIADAQQRFKLGGRGAAAGALFAKALSHWNVHVTREGVGWRGSGHADLLLAAEPRAAR